MTFTECVRPPPLPVIVRVRVPFCPFFIVLTVNTDVPEPSSDAGLKVAVVREGSPVTVRFTGPENAAPAVTVTVYVVELPRLIVRDAGVAAIVKSPLTTSVTFAVRVRGPLVPLMTRG